MRKSARILCAALLLLAACEQRQESIPAQIAGTTWVYVATARGIHQLELDNATGVVKPSGLPPAPVNANFLAVHPGGRHVYAVGDASGPDAKRGGTVHALKVDPRTGTLTALNHESSRGAGPVHVTVDAEGKYVLVANYAGGSVTALPIEPDGWLAPASDFVQHAGSSVNPTRQAGPHAHSIVLDPAGRFAFVPDLGLDKVLVYRFADGKFASNDPPAVLVSAGAGPRHLAVHPRGRHAYVINELANTVTAFTLDPPKGVLKEVQTLSALPPGQASQPGYSGAELLVHPSGNFLYGSIRGHDSIVVFSIDAGSGRLSYVEHQPVRGKTPRNFGIEPEGRFLLAANQGSGTVVVFRIEQKSGRLEYTGQTVEVPAPMCVRFIRARN